MEDNVIRADIMVRRLYHNVMDAAYLWLPWLANYIDSLFSILRISSIRERTTRTAAFIAKNKFFDEF
jgi:hypothetical protein